MGYRHKPKNVEIKLDGDFAGFEATARGLTLGEYLEVVDGLGVWEMIRRFAGSLVEWNLETPDGTPVPATEEAVLGQDKELMMAAANAWIDGLSGVSKDSPLPESSPDGGPSPAVSTIPMEPLSESRENSPVPS